MKRTTLFLLLILVLIPFPGRAGFLSEIFLEFSTGARDFMEDLRTTATEFKIRYEFLAYEYTPQYSFYLESGRFGLRYELPTGDFLNISYQTRGILESMELEPEQIFELVKQLHELKERIEKASESSEDKKEEYYLLTDGTNNPKSLHWECHDWGESPFARPWSKSFNPDIIRKYLGSSPADLASTTSGNTISTTAFKVNDFDLSHYRMIYSAAMDTVSIASAPNKVLKAAKCIFYFTLPQRVLPPNADAYNSEVKIQF
jgi:hypothetical protein